MVQELVCGVCFAKANPTPTGWQCAANSSHKGEDEQRAAASSDKIVGELNRPSAVYEQNDIVPLPQSNHLGQRIASTRQTRAVGTPVAGMMPTEEQEAIITAASKPWLRVLVIAAGAGCGKTAQLKMLEQVLPGRGQYTAFNTSLVAESKTKFTKAAVNTTHSLAFRAVGRLYNHRLGGDRVKSYQIAQMLDLQSFTVTIKGGGAPGDDGKPTDKVKVLQPDFLAGQVMAAVKMFCQSADREIATKHLRRVQGIDTTEKYLDFDGELHTKYGTDNSDRVRDYLLPFAQKAWADISNVNGTLPFSHDNYVKIWGLGEGTDRPVIAADYILLDEAQDTAPVFLDILKQQTHAMLVLVGDDNQQIYEWRGAVNAMGAFDGAPRKLLSQSYRFGQAVADVANTVLAELDEATDLVMRGMPTIPSRVAAIAEPRCYLYRTNAGAVGRVMTAIGEKNRPYLIGGGDDVVKWCQAALDLKAKRGTKHPELCCFDTWKEVVDYSETEEGEDMALMVSLVTKFGADKIRDALKDMPEEADADLVVSTAHRSKGREWDTVRLGPDFPTANKMCDADRRLLYVAATRAKLTLDLSECPPFCGGKDHNSNEWIPGLRINYTARMPSEQDQQDWAAAPVQPMPAAIVEQPKVIPCTNVSCDTKPFGWYNYRGTWVLRGRPNTKVGEKVTAKRNNGSVSSETIKGVAQMYDDAWLYNV